jgi:hypothetical protein
MSGPKPSYRNKQTGTVYKSVSFNGTVVARVETASGSRYNVYRDKLELVTPGPEKELNVEAELREQLADIEHQRWSSWQAWVFEGCGQWNEDGSFTIRPDKAAKMKRQIETPYQELTRPEQEADLREVDRYWPLIHQVSDQRVREYSEQVKTALHTRQDKMMEEAGLGMLPHNGYLEDEYIDQTLADYLKLKEARDE